MVIRRPVAFVWLVGVIFGHCSPNPGYPAMQILSLSWGLTSLFGSRSDYFWPRPCLPDPFFRLEPFLKGFAAVVLGGLNRLLPGGHCRRAVVGHG